MQFLLNSVTKWNHGIGETFNVNPLIYAALYVFSIPPFWYGILRMAKSLVKSRRQQWTWKEAVGDASFRLGISITAFAWAMPVVYLIVWGRNLPLWIYALTAASVVLFIFSLRRSITKKVKTLAEN